MDDAEELSNGEQQSDAMSPTTDHDLPQKGVSIAECEVKSPNPFSHMIWSYILLGVIITAVVLLLLSPIVLFYIPQDSERAVSKAALLVRFFRLHIKL